jgi:hypothetical protein
MVPGVVTDMWLKKKWPHWRVCALSSCMKKFPINDVAEFSCKTLSVQGLISTCLNMQVSGRENKSVLADSNDAEKLRYLTVSKNLVS